MGLDVRGGKIDEAPHSLWTCFMTVETYRSRASSTLVKRVKPYFLTCLKSSGG